MNIERMLCNGNWSAVSSDWVEKFIEKVAKFRMISTQSVYELLEKGETARYDTDWYAKIRTVKEKVVAEPVETTRCSCGHVVEKVLVMNTSSGSSCPDCYDRMSD